MRALHTTLGSLACHIFQGDDAPPRLIVVMCHGYGAPGTDLVGLAAETARGRPELQGGVRWVFPEAPLSLGEVGYPDGRAWWHLDLDRRLRLQQQGARGVETLSEEVPEGLPTARRKVMALLEEVCQTAQLPLGRVVLGGFSQGAMLMTDLALSLEDAPAALVLFSGTLICSSEWTKKAERRRGLPVLQTHGRQDAILPFSQAERLAALLAGSGLEVDFHPFQGPHTIPPLGLERLGALLSRRLPTA